MSNIVFASNNISHWPLSVSSTQAGTFDSSRVPYSFKLIYEETIASPDFPVAAGDTTWIHFRTWTDGAEFNDERHMMRVFDANQNKLCELHKFTDGSFAKDVGLKAYNGASTIAVNSGFPLNNAKMNSIDVKIKVTAGVIEISLFINGGLAAIAFHVTNPNSFGKPTHFVLANAYSTNAKWQYFSEVLVSDTDTRNARMSLLRPTAEGGETDWVGLATELADDDPTSGMTTTVVDKRETLLLSAYSGPDNISSVVVATQTMAGANGPQNLRHTVRMATVNYDSVADILLSPVLQYDVTDFQINPATSLPWVASDLGSLEVGFVSKT